MIKDIAYRQSHAETILERVELKFTVTLVWSKVLGLKTVFVSKNLCMHVLVVYRQDPSKLLPCFVSSYDRKLFSQK